MIYIIHPPYEKGYTMTFNLEGKIMEKIDRTDWYEPECLIQFVPDNESVTGNILIKLRIY
ncbi:hypothetical protein FACS189483_00630 [Spirochaetia bacterium]|nr:hypothetical protein FACS189483_00630 [Spirochaetia bacterium]